MSPDPPLRCIDLQNPPRLAQAAQALHGRARLREQYRLPELWSLHLYDYEADLEVDGVRLPIRPRSVSLTAPGMTMVYTYRGPSRHLYAHFCAGVACGLEGARIPAMQRLNLAQAAALEQDLREMIAWFPAQPRRSEARLWDLLWGLAQHPAEGPRRDQPAHPALQQAVQHIEMHLDREVDVADLARRVGVSHNHLIRLFRRHTGQTIVGYMRQRRAQRARHLLTHSTLPIKTIACSVGLHDLQRFNKTIRRETGRSPRELRGKT